MMTALAFVGQPEAPSVVPTQINPAGAPGPPGPGGSPGQPGADGKIQSFLRPDGTQVSKARLSLDDIQALAKTGDGSGLSGVAKPADIATRLAVLGNDVTASPDNSVADKIPFANTGSKHFIYSRRNAPASALLGTTTLVRNMVGSGTFGPGSADFAALTSTTKDNWQTATGAAAGEGELDTLISIARQGKKGDTAAYVGDVLKRRDNLTSVASDESGAPIILEGGVGLVDASGNEYLSFHSLLGFIESPTGLSGGRGYGELQEARIGTGWSAHHASAVSSSAAWMYYYTGAQTRDPSSLNYLVDNAGRTTVGFPSARMSWGFDATANAYTLLDAVGGTERMRVARDGGGVTVTGQYAAIAMVDPVTGGAAGGSHRITFAGNGAAIYQVSTSAAGWGPGGTAANAYSVGPGGAVVFYGPPKLPSYTVGTLPTPGTAGRVAYCSNVRVLTAGGAQQSPGAGTGGQVTDDGTAWRVTGTNIQAQA